MALVSIPIDHKSKLSRSPCPHHHDGYDKPLQQGCCYSQKDDL